MKIENKIDFNNNTLFAEKQKDFLETTVGKTVNTAIDIGIRSLLPNFLEDQIINIKDNLMKFGLKEGITKTVDDVIDFGKSAMGIVTGNFENISQMHNAIKSGGIVDGVSKLLDTVVDKVKNEGLINSSVANTIKQGKDVILNNVEKNIENNFSKQYESIELANKYISNWKKAFEEQNFDSMEKEYKKIEKQSKNIAPIQKTVENIKEIEILHKLIKNNGQNFNLSNEQMELVNNLK